jgi:hypothetical protein
MSKLNSQCVTNSLMRRLAGITFATVVGCALFEFRADAAARTNAPSASDFSAFKILNQRNIFNTRRSASYTPSERKETRRAARSESFALVGTMNYDKGLFAFFDGSSSSYKKVLKQEDTIAGFKVAHIETSQVKLVAGTNEVELHMGMQMRREDEGEWHMSVRPETAEPSGGVAAASRPYYTETRRERKETPEPAAPEGGDLPFNPEAVIPAVIDALAPQLGLTNGPTTLPLPPSVVPPPAGGEEDVLERLRRRREQENN